MHLDLHEPFVTAYSVEEDSGVFIAFSTLSMLFNPLKVVNSRWQLQVQADATFRVCVEEVGLLGFGVNSLGAKFHLTVVSMIPQSIENKKAYLETWKSVNSSLNLLLRTHIRCPLKGCEACDFLHVIKTQESVEDLFHEDRFKLPVHVASSDNKQAFHIFRYDEFYPLLIRAMNCPWLSLAPIIQSKLVVWLRDKEQTRAAEWFERTWTGEKGHWMLCHSGYNAATTNNGLESTWRHLKQHTTNGSTSMHLPQFLVALHRYLNHLSEEKHFENKRAGPLYMFQSSPIETPGNWLDVQHWKSEAMFGMHLEKGSRDKFDEYVCHFDRQDLLMGSRTARLYQVVARLKAEGEMLNSKDIQKKIVPTQSFLKYLEGKKGNDWLDPCNEARMQYVAVLRNAEAATADMSLEDVLRTMENFVSVERLPDDVRWSDNGAFKCTCADCHKYCVCEHTILMALVTNEVEIPVKYILSTLPHRRPHG